MSSLTGSVHRVTQRPSLVAVVLGICIVGSVLTEWLLLSSKLRRLEIQYQHLEEMVEARQKDGTEHVGRLEALIAATSKTLAEADDELQKQTKMTTKTIATVAGQAAEQAGKALANTNSGVDDLKQVSDEVQKQQQLLSGISQSVKSWQKKLDDVEASMLSFTDIEKVTKLVTQHGEELQQLRKEVQAEHESLSSILTQHQASVASLAEKQQSLESHVSTVVKDQSDKAAAAEGKGASLPTLQLSPPLQATTEISPKPERVGKGTTSTSKETGGYDDLEQEEGGALQVTPQLDDEADATEADASKSSAAASSPAALAGTRVETVPGLVQLSTPNTTARAKDIQSVTDTASPAVTVSSLAAARAGESDLNAAAAAAQRLRGGPGGLASPKAAGSQGAFHLLRDEIVVKGAPDATTAKALSDDAGFEEIKEGSAGDGLQAGNGVKALQTLGVDKALLLKQPKRAAPHIQLLKDGYSN